MKVSGRKSLGFATAEKVKQLFRLRVALRALRCRKGVCGRIATGRIEYWLMRVNEGLVPTYGVNVTSVERRGLR